MIIITCEGLGKRGKRKRQDMITGEQKRVFNRLVEYVEREWTPVEDRAFKDALRFLMDNIKL